MEKWQELGKTLNRFLRPHTFPLAVQLGRSDLDIPERARRPFSAFGQKLAPCQGAALARKYGWTFAVGPDDCGCAIANQTYGWDPLPDPKPAVQFMLGMQYAYDEAAALAALSAGPLLPPGTCRAVIYSPLEWTHIPPDLIMVYANPAQIMRLIHGATYRQGTPIRTSLSGRAASCTEGVLAAYIDQAPKVVVPGNGDRVWGAAQDDEMVFVLPASQLESVVEGLERTHERGVRYPIPTFLGYQPMVGLDLPLTDIYKVPVNRKNGERQ